MRLFYCLSLTILALCSLGIKNPAHAEDKESAVPGIKGQVHMEGLTQYVFDSEMWQRDSVKEAADIDKDGVVSDEEKTAFLANIKKNSEEIMARKNEESTYPEDTGTER